MNHRKRTDSGTVPGTEIRNREILSENLSEFRGTVTLYLFHLTNSRYSTRIM